VTPTELALATNHRQNQVALEAATALQLVDLFRRLVDPADLAQTSVAWVPVAMNVVEDSHRRSNALARAYIRTALLARLGTSPSGRLPQPSVVADALRTSLLFRGPGIISRALARGGDITTAFRLATAEQARAGSRHALNGGRQTVDAYVAGERAAGWRRITAASACSFCSMLAGRGAIYSEATVGFQAHDGCNCQPGIEYRA
jgi:hypothetical protein